MVFAMRIVTMAAAGVRANSDAVDSGGLPGGNFPHYGAGLSLEAATTVLRTLGSTPTLAAITLTEVNPSYDPSRVQLGRYGEAVAATLAI
jgi:arginase